MRWVDLKFLTNENHSFYDRRFCSPWNFDTLISFLHLSSWFLENESILVGIFMANPYAHTVTTKTVSMMTYFGKKSLF
jgi:hypothetical protein